MRLFRKGTFLIVILITGCDQFVASKAELPVQVVYRFDDHRYLELEGFHCEGALWYNDTQRKIRSEVVERDSPIFRISFFKYVHPSEKYISVPWDDMSGFLISKDYGQTWQDARFVPGGGAERYGKWHPAREEVGSYTVVNDQAFILTKTGDLYISSKPFDDPRLEPGGEGIPYTETSADGKIRSGVMTSRNSGQRWGKEYISWNAVAGPTPWDIGYRLPKWQNIPNKVPEVKNYTGWDRMQCNPDLGLSAERQETKDD
ncbi:hypothetical protein EJH27_02060 [Salmonella enterica subsp. enterica serovar Virchow]|nr:hypothetical protein [Salmonella enterica subsp. enterica serovar Virchow]